VTLASFFIAPAMLRRFARLAAIFARISVPLLGHREGVAASRTAEIRGRSAENAVLCLRNASTLRLPDCEVLLHSS